MEAATGRIEDGRGAPPGGNIPPGGPSGEAYGRSHLAAAALAGVIVGYVVGTLLPPSTRQPGGSGFVAAPVPASSGGPVAGPAGGAGGAGPTEAEYERVQMISSRFRCGCGNCEGEALHLCDCSHPAGAVEVKGFILSALRAGKSENEAAALVAQRYPNAIVPPGGAAAPAAPGGQIPAFAR